MFTLKVLAMLFLAVPAVDEWLPARAETVELRLLLVREGMPVEVVGQLLRLDQYSTVHSFGRDATHTRLYWVPPGRCLDITCEISAGEFRLDHAELD